MNDHTAHFIELMFGAGSSNTFQTFHDSRKGEPATIVHGTYAEAAPTLDAAQGSGHGVFVTVNETDGAGRARENVTAARFVWVDLDQDGTAKLARAKNLLMPHAVVESSPGKFHVYWRVSDCSLDEFDALLDAITNALGGDKGAKGLNRVLRLPGYLHQKGEPFVSVIVAEDWRPGLPAYTVAQLRRALLASAVEPAAPSARLDVEWTDAPAAGWANPRTDAEVLAKCTDPHYRGHDAAQMFGDKETLHDLWTSDVSRFEGRRSEARMSLLSQLMTLCGGNCAQLYRLAHDHPLATKDGREKLFHDEILKAQAGFLAWWEPEHARRDAQRAETVRIGEAVGESILPTILTLDEMVARLVYVAAMSEVADRITGRIRSWDAARGELVGSRHKFDDAQGKAHNVAALPLWRSDHARLTVDVSTWAPGRGEFCAPAETVNGNSRAFNTWRGLKAVAAPSNWREWIVGFEQHVAYLVPDEAQRRRFLQWLAHIVQQPGALPHTSYLMIAKETGIGRNWLAAVLARVLPGYVAAGISLAPILDGKFNGRLSQKLLATVDETREGMTEHRHARGEALKRLITEEHRLIDTKYGRQVVEFNCCRWLMFSNHFDALPFDANDRRVIVIENPGHRQPPEYFVSLYSLLQHSAFIASVGQYLRELDLAGFNPGEPAPMNAAKQRALSTMTSGIDEAVREFKAAWPGAIAGRSDVRAFVMEATGEQPRDAALSHALERAGYTQWTRRIKVRAMNDRAITLLFTTEELEAMEPSQVADVIDSARSKFSSTGSTGSTGFLQSDQSGSLIYGSSSVGLVKPGTAGTAGTGVLQ